MSFMSDLFNGKIDDPLEKILDYIEEWHSGKGADASLYKYLGMSLEEYKLYTKSPISFFNSPILVGIEDNWADEINIQGFVIMDLKSLYSFYEKLNKYFKQNPNGKLSYCIGTNEYIEHNSLEDIIYCLTPCFITLDEAEVIKTIIGKNYGFTGILDILEYV